MSNARAAERPSPAARPRPQGPRRPRGRRRAHAAPWWLVVTAVAVGLAFAAPLGFLVVRNLTSVGYWRSLGDDALLGPLLRTLLLATTTAAATAAIGTAAAWLVVRADLPGRSWWRLVLPLPLVIPSFIGAFTLIAAFAPGGLLEGLLAPLGLDRLPQVRGFSGSLLVLTLLTYPYVYLPVAARLDQLPPSLEEAARLLGRRPAAVFRDIVLPQIRSAVLAGTLLVFLYAISDFGAVELMRYDTLTRAIFVAYGSLDLAAGLALSLNLGMLALLVVVLERVTARAPRPATERTVAGLRVALGRWRWPALAGMVALAGLALAAPLTVLVSWAARGLLQGTARAGALVADLSALLEPTWNTARVSLVAAAASIVVVLPIAMATVRYRSRAAAGANALVVAGFALPGLAIALALTFWTLRVAPLQGLRDSVPLLVFAYVVHFGAQSLRAAEVAVASVPPRLDDAARALGAGRWRRLATVDLPLMGPGLLAGGGLVLLSTMKELPATLLLAPPGFQTLATRIWLATEDAFLADASVASLLLILLSGVLTWALVIRRAGAL